MHCLPAAVGFALSLFAVTARAQEPVTAFVNVSVIPMDRERVLSTQTVLVQGDRVMAMGPTDQIQVPAAATRIDGTGKFLIPGLGDMHAHVPGMEKIMNWLLNGNRPLADDEGRAVAERMLYLYLANGVTTVRLMYGWPETLALRDRAAKGELLSPRIYTATMPLYGDGSFVQPVSLGSPSEAVAFVQAAKAEGYDFIKMYGLNGELSDTLAAAARRVGIPIAGHAPETADGLEEAIRMGYRSIEHLRGFPEYFTEGQALDGDYINSWPAQLLTDTAKLETMAAAMRRANVWNCPTQLLYETSAMDPDSVQAWPEWRYLKTDAHQRLQVQLQKAGKRKEAAQAVVKSRRAIIKALYEAGVELLLGTDAPVGGIPGFSVHRELETLVRAGLTPYDALATGTRNVASYFGTLDHTGTVAVGKRADLVLLTGNPLTDIRHTANPAGVMIGGRWLPRSELDTRLAALEGTLDD